MTNKTKIALVITIFLWASAFVGIREGLQAYSPEGLALLRYLVASIFMGYIYFRMPNKQVMHWRDVLSLMGIGVLGIGSYNILLNYGELTVPSGMASFIISQAPIVSAIIAIIFLGESINFFRTIGFLISILGVTLIATHSAGSFEWNISIIYILISTVIAGFYSVLQKSFLNRYHAIEVTTYIIWGATLFLCLYASHLHQDIVHASLKVTMVVVYLGVFPAGIAYLAWAYVLSEISVSRASSFLYFMPFTATFLGWLCLGETPSLVSLLGGLLAILGVAVVNHSYRLGKIVLEPVSRVD